MPGRVAVVTDSAASPGGCRDHDSQASSGAARAGVTPVTVVPLRLLAGAQVADDAGGSLPGPIAAAVARGERLTTSRPAPERFAAAYAAAAAAGAPGVVSVHLSGELSGTIGSARLAAATAPVPVHVVDSRSIGAGLGMVVRAAAQSAAAGQPAEQVARAAARRAAAIGLFFALDSQDQLRAGGRLGELPGAAPASAGAGSLLRSRPLLQVAGGRIVVLERVRTRSAARERLAELAAGFAAGRPAELAVQHIGNPGGADDLRRQLAAAIPAAGPATVTEAGAAILAHAGPGLLAVAVAT
jgi:DegV family protein with EDD domain